VLFALSAGIGLISLCLMRWSVAEPRHETENQVMSGKEIAHG
jgi:hypothetical protein